MTKICSKRERDEVTFQKREKGMRKGKERGRKRERMREKGKERGKKVEHHLLRRHFSVHFYLLM